MADPLPPEDRDALAAELALGLIEGEERAAALRLQLSDPAFSAAVEAWRTRLDPLCADFAEATAPEIWPAIERRLEGAGAAAQVRRWRFAAFASGAVAASLAAVLMLRPLPAPVEIVRLPESLVVAQLDGGKSGALLAANYDPGQGMLRIRAVAMPESALAPELWIIPADGVPRSLGLVAAHGLSLVGVPVAHRKLIQDGALLAITMEPRDGAPHDKPSAAPIAAGKISTI
ncbi:MAG: hypothetical protein EOP60_08385 [Sphingomonadales bacterium]|nr:MAG: hypothetical protein EOP60_08385 [Sphingomonadales bacterium]